MQSAAPTPTAAPATPPGQRHEAGAVARRVLRLFLTQRELTPILITIGLFAYFAIRAGSSFTGSLSLSSAAGYAGPIGAIAVGEVLLLVLGEIDLSAGQVFLFAPWVEYWLHNAGVGVLLAILLALVVCCGVGAINGLITVRLNVPSFVTTLATNFILFGVVLIESSEAQASPIPLSAPGSNGQVSFAGQFLGAWQWSELLWLVGITIVATVLLRRTRFGVRIIAAGGNLVGAAEAGVPVRRVKVWAFVLCSFLSGLVGIVDAVKYGSLDPGNFGVDYILYAIGACVIGGTALTGGRGTIVGAFIGAILIGILEDGLTVIGISTDDFYVYIGVVIIIAMALNSQFDRLVARSRGA
ncbi:MAG TPA: ABC transporter permease [Solirubrobacteraceae bacterium]|nr:ABC transporter permease [Solirubrobacteraceae bacterium]